MNVASLEHCKELYELSGWETDKYYWEDNRSRPVIPEYRHPKILEYKPLWLHNPKENVDNHVVPAFDAGYLLRKLPYSEDTGAMSFGFVKQGHWYLNFILTGIRGAGMQSSYNAEADIPEDALCLLAIELFKAGILKKEQS